MKPVLSAWLDLVCQMLPNVQHALLRLDDSEPSEPSEFAWPAKASPPESLRAAAGLALSQGSPVFSSGEPYALVAYPIELEDGARAALALSLSVTSYQQAAILQLLGWSQSWLRLLLRQAYARQNAVVSRANVGTGAADDLSWLWDGLRIAPDVETLGVSLTTRLANHLGSQRVWLGAGPVDRLHVAAVSNQSSFDARVNLVGMVEEAMLECLEQGGALLWDGKQELPAHAALAREAHASVVVSFPIVHAGAPEGVLLFEQQEGTTWTGVEAANGEAVAHQLGPILSLQRQLKPNWLGRLENFLSGGIARLLGPGSLMFKGVSALLVLVLLLLVFGEGQHQVKSDAFVEGLEQQSIAAPFDGFIASAEVRAGESVSTGQELARMEDKDIRLDLQQVQGEREALERE